MMDYELDPTHKHASAFGVTEKESSVIDTLIATLVACPKSDS
ncbi:MAG: hypothetical protein ACKN82_03930 [Pirellula sp.]|jgi:hypothetical protein